MRLVNQINLNHLKIFEAVYRTNNMTKAAEELNLTQSGISQHIKTLEENLGLKLFDREKQKLVSTANANTLYERCRRGLNDLEELLRELCASSKEIVGNVRVGMPTEFGMNVIIPIINKLLKKHHGIRVEYVFGLGSKISDLLLNGEIDFAFVDGYSVDRRFDASKIYVEKLELCGSVDYLKSHPKPQNTLKFYERLCFIGYIRANPIILMWLRHHLDLASNVRPVLDVAAITPVAQSIYRMVKTGLGVGILPHHFLEHLPKKERDRLFVFPASKSPLQHTISMVSLPGRTQSYATDFFMDEIKETLKDHPDAAK